MVFIPCHFHLTVICPASIVKKRGKLGARGLMVGEKLYTHTALQLGRGPWRQARSFTKFFTPFVKPGLADAFQTLLGGLVTNEKN